MTRHPLLLLVFALGLVAIGGIAAGYVGNNPLGLGIVLLIGACYLAGAFELWRYRQATAALRQAVDALAEPPVELAPWLARLPASLRHAVRLRVEGERAALPAPSMTPYLVGLLVLLGMLGTLLGMMATLRGTGTALGSASDLQAIRGALAAPVNGLAFAFGTSIAGVASSAMLGLLAALVRRERLHAVQGLDTAIATTLRPHSRAYQREQAFQLLQQQASAMPALVDRLQAMAATLEQHSTTAHERLHAEREAFHRHTEATYTRLADTVQQSLQAGIASSAHTAAGVLQPVVESTLASLARESAAIQASVGEAVQRQLDGLAGGFDTTARTVTGIWTEALAQHRQTNDAHAQALGEALARFADTFAQRSSALLDDVAARMDASVERTAEAWRGALARQDATHAELASQHQLALSAAGDTLQSHATALVQALEHSHTALQASLQSRDEERLAAWAQKLDAITTALGAQWKDAGDATAARQQAICDTLEQTADAIATQAQAAASQTLAEIARLVEAAAEAPRVAAEVVGELRQKLSDSMVRDTAMLEERSRLLATLETLLDAVNHASTEQRSAVDALVSTSADLLDRVGSRLAAQIDSEAGKLDHAAAQVTASAAEVASLGEAFGAGVAQFGQSNDALMERLQHIATALDAAQSRSDEQLAYYVAQAREVVELSVLSQQQIIADMQQLAGRGKAGKA